MSTYAYAQLTARRLQAQERTSETTSPPGVATYVDAFAALVPAEVLAIHALIFSVTTKVENNVTIITAPGTLKAAFFGLIALSIFLYLLARLCQNKAGKWEGLDYLRMLIPPAAFIGWTMLQRPTAFDAVCPGMLDAERTVIALFLGALLGAIAKAFADKADRKPPSQ